MGRSDAIGRLAGPLLVLPLLTTACGGTADDTADEASVGEATNDEPSVGEATNDEAPAETTAEDPLDGATATTGVGTTTTAAGAPDKEAADVWANAEEALADSAEALDANMMVTKPDPDRILVWSNGSVATVASFDTEGYSADGRFLYQWWGEGVDIWSKASSPDGTVVCEVEGHLYHVTERADGSFVAAVEPALTDDDPLPPTDEGLPLFAEDCATGERQPIEPRWYPGDEVGGTAIERVAGRVFRLAYDAEGNATIRNEAGIMLNDDDYSGYATFDRAGSRVAYGDMAAGAGPHYSSVVVGRDTTTGERLWRLDLDVPFVSLHFVDDRLVVLLAESPEAVFDGEPIPATAVVLDGTTGDELKRIELGFPIAHLS